MVRFTKCVKRMGNCNKRTHSPKPLISLREKSKDIVRKPRSAEMENSNSSPHPAEGSVVEKCQYFSIFSACNQCWDHVSSLSMLAHACNQGKLHHLCNHSLAVCARWNAHEILHILHAINCGNYHILYCLSLQVRGRRIGNLVTKALYARLEDWMYNTNGKTD